MESCSKSQNQGIPGQPGAVMMIRQLDCLAIRLPDFLDHPVKESRGRESISSDT